MRQFFPLSINQSCHEKHFMVMRALLRACNNCTNFELNVIETRRGNTTFIFTFLTSLTLKAGQGNRYWYEESVKLNGGYQDSEFQSPLLNILGEKATAYPLFSRHGWLHIRNAVISSLKYTPKSGKVFCAWSCPCIHVTTVQRLSSIRSSLPRKKQLSSLACQASLWPWIRSR